MRRFRLIIAPFTVLIGAVVLGTGTTTYPGPAKAQESTRVTRPPKPTIYPSFELDVLVDGRRLRECYERGRTYVEAIRDAEYEIRLRNPSRERVAVALSVDGLSTIDARQTSAWNASKWVIEPYQTIISGWQMNSQDARRFYFTNERDSYAAKLGRTSNLGVISAVFFRERRRVVVPITPPPIYREDRRSSGESATMEAPAPSASAKSRSRDEAATGIGRSVRHDVDWIDMELDSRPVAEVTIRYLFPN